MPRASTKRCCPDTERSAPTVIAASSAQDEELARLAWAVAHPARVRLLRILISQASCVCGELVEQIPLAQSTVSQHLKILKEAGLITGEIDGPRVCYCVNRNVLERLKDLIGVL